MQAPSTNSKQRIASLWARQVAPFLIASFFAVLALVAIRARRPWHDEYFTWYATRLPSTADLIKLLHQDSGPPGFYIAERMLPDGAGVRALRMLPAAAAVFAVLVIACTDVAAGLLLASSPLLLLHAANARAYTFLVAGSALALAWVRSFSNDDYGNSNSSSNGYGKGNSTRSFPFQLLWVGAAAIVGACLLWCHYLAVPLLAGFVAASFAAGRRIAKVAAIASGAAVALFLPWLPVAFSQPRLSVEWMRGAVGWGWIPALVFSTPSPIADWSGWADLAPSWWLAAVLSFFVGAVALGAGLLLRRASAWFWFFSASAVVGVQLLSGSPAYYPARAEMIWLPAAVMTLAWGARRIGKVGLFLLMALVILGVVQQARSISLWRGVGERPEETVARVIRKVVPSGDTIVCTTYWYLGLSYWAGIERWRWLTFPPETLSHPGWYSEATVGPEDVDELKTILNSSGVRPCSVWMVRTARAPSDRWAGVFCQRYGLAPWVVGKHWSLWGPPPECHHKQITGRLQ